MYLVNIQLNEWNDHKIWCERTYLSTIVVPTLDNITGVVSLMNSLIYFYLVAY